MKPITSAALACTLACLSTLAQSQSQYGKFTLSAPVSVEAPELSVRWQFGLTLNIDPQGVSAIKFSCNQLPGTTFTVKMSDMQQKNGGYYTEGPVTPVTNKTMPWLFTPSYTFSNCNANIHTTSNGEVTISTRLIYTEELKTETLQKLKATHEARAKKP